MNLLITGGCGFLGSNLASYALDQGLDIIVFDNLQRNGAIDNLQWLQQHSQPFTFIHGDIRNTNDVENLIFKYKPEVIFHLAGQVAMTTSIASPRFDFEVNTLGSFNLLDSVRKYIPDTIIVYSSTNKVYGDLEQFNYQETDSRYICQEKPNGFDELINLDFHSPYGVSKGSADQYMLDYNRIFGIKTVVFRHSSMYGGRQFATADQGWIGWFCKKAIEAKRYSDKYTKELDTFSIAGSGKQVRDVLYAKDMINLYFNAVENIDKAQGQAFNIGGGLENSLSLLELFKFLEDMLDVKLVFDKLPVRQSDQKVFIADISKAKQLLNWAPAVDYKTGITEMLNWVKELYK